MTSKSLPSLPLGPGGCMTSKLGFGCSGISGGLARRTSLTLLEAAYDAGIRHFDVAPMYGFGTAEEILGEFAVRHAGHITLATKYGIAAPASGAALNTLRTVIRPIANRLPVLRRSLIRKAGEVAATKVATNFSAEGAMLSLETSLRKLRVERLDLFLLHEATVSDLTDDRLLYSLQEAQRAGKIVQFGVASPMPVAREVSTVHPKYCPVLQHEWSVLAPASFSKNSFHVCHRTIASGLQELGTWLKNRPAVQDTWSDEVGCDLSCVETLAQLLLNTSCAHTPGIVLFSSRQQQRIQRNVACVTDAEVSIAAHRLAALLQKQTAETFPDPHRLLASKGQAPASEDLPVA